MSDAQYVIEVASTVSGVDATTAELDSLAGMLSGSGVNAAMFDDALTALSSQLDAAKASTSAANAALAAGRANYAALEQAAVAAAKGVEKIEAGLATAQGAMAAAQSNLDAAVASGAGEEEIAKLSAEAEKAAKNLRKASTAAGGLDDAKAAAAQAEQAARAYAGELDHLEREAAQAASAQKQLETAMATTAKVQKRVNDNLGDAATKMSTFRGALGDIGGPIAEFGEKLLFPAQAFVDLNERFGRGTAIAAVAGFGLLRVVTAVISAFAALTVAVGAGIIAIAAFSIASSNAARTLALTREAAEIATPALRGLPWREVTDATGIAEARLRELARTLIDAKVSTADMPAALRAIATAEAALGQGGADELVAALKAGKISATEFADTIESKFGDVVARQLLGLEAQGARFKRNIGDAFDFDIDPALEGLRTLVEMFGKNSATGRAMRAALEGIMDPLIANAKAAAFTIEAFAIGFAIGATRIYIAVKPAIDRVAELLGLDASEWTLDDALDLAAAAGEKIAPVLAILVGVFAVLGAGVLAVVGVTVWLSTVMIEATITATLFAAGLMGAGVEAARAIASAIGDAVAAVFGAVGAFTSAGADLIAGLVQGILSGAPQVIAAITGIAAGAIATAKAILGIASPSKAFGEVGDNVVEGFVGSVEAGRDAAHVAVAEMTAPPSAQSGGTSSTSTTVSTATSSSSERTVIIEHLELHGVADPDAFLDWVESVAGRAAA